MLRPRAREDALEVVDALDKVHLGVVHQRLGRIVQIGARLEALSDEALKVAARAVAHEERRRAAQLDLFDAAQARERVDVAIGRIGLGGVDREVDGRRVDVGRMDQLVEVVRLAFAAVVDELRREQPDGFDGRVAERRSGGEQVADRAAGGRMRRVE